MAKSPDAFRTISEVADDLDLPQHVLRFWETRFSQIKPMKRGGGRRYYRPDDIDLLRGIRFLLYGEGYTIRGVQRILKEQGARFVIAAGRGEFEGEGLADTAAAAVAQREEQPRRGGRSEPERVEPTFAGSARPPAQCEHPRAAERPVEPEPAPQPRQRAPAETAATGLSPQDVKMLEATLAELLECKRLLDQAG